MQQSEDINMTAISMNSVPATFEKLRNVISAFWSVGEQRPSKFIRVLSEALALRVSKGILTSYYLTGRLGESELTWTEKKEYLSPKQYEDIVWKLNASEYRKISQHKLAEKSLLSTLGIPTPQFFGYFHPKAGRDTAGQKLCTAADLEILFRNLVNGRSSLRVCLKMTEGWNGVGFISIVIKQSQENNISIEMTGDAGGEQSVAELCAELVPSAGYVIEAFIDQHEAYAEFHPTSINGYRFWVAEDLDGNTSVLLGNLRFGRGGAEVDNRGDHMLVDLDVDTGALGKGYFLNLNNGSTDTHPDSGKQISGAKLPYFEEAKQLACDALDAFPHMRFAGVDIAISKDGPVVLELNVQPGYLAAAICRKPVRDLLSPLIEKKGEAS
jgi:hypothetical protein